MSKQTLEQYVTEVAGDNAEIRGKLLEILGANEDAGKKFISGFEARAESTRRFQSASEEKKKAEQLLQDYANRLNTAEVQLKKAMTDLASHRITSAKATAIIDSLKEKYQLSDDDIPSLSEIRQTEQSGKVPKGAADVDIDAKLTEFKTNFMKEFQSKLMPELTAMGRLGAIWVEIADDHRELTGKRLTQAEKDAIFKHATEKGMPLSDAWEELHNIRATRTTRHEADLEKKFREKWEKERVQKASEDAMQGRRPDGPAIPESQRSRILSKRNDFKPRVDEGQDGRQDRQEGRQQMQQKQDTQNQQPRLRGAEAAAANFNRRRNLGIPMGEKEPVGSAA